MRKDEGRHASAEDEDGTRTLTGIAVGATVGALAWAGLIQAWVWASDGGEAVARVGAFLALVVGAGLVFLALAEIGGGR